MISDNPMDHQHHHPSSEGGGTVGGSHASPPPLLSSPPPAHEEENFHSDAETHHTDDLLRHGEVDFGIPPPAPPHPLLGSDAEEEEEEDGQGPTPPSSYSYYSSLKQNTRHVVKECSERGHAAVKTTANHLSTTLDIATANATHLVSTLADRLRALAARVRAFAAHHQPHTHRLMGLVAGTVQEIVRSLQMRVVTPGLGALSVPVSGVVTAVSDITVAFRIAAARLLTRACSFSASKAGYHCPNNINGDNNNTSSSNVTGVEACKLNFNALRRDLDWIRVGLVVTSAALLGMLWRVNAANAQLMSRLAQREGELAELVARIVALQRNITSQRVPIIRHTTAVVPASGWTAVVQAI